MISVSYSGSVREVLLWAMVKEGLRTQRRCSNNHFLLLTFSNSLSQSLLIEFFGEISEIHDSSSLSHSGAFENEKPSEAPVQAGNEGSMTEEIG
jgi:hypothetical protein